MRTWMLVVLLAGCGGPFLRSTGFRRGPTRAPGPLDGSWDGVVASADGPVGRLILELKTTSPGFYAGTGEFDDLDDAVWTSFALTLGDPSTSPYTPGDGQGLKLALDDCRDDAGDPTPCEEVAGVVWTPERRIAGNLPSFRDFGACAFALEGGP